jgi:hypothetical protein
MVHTIRWRVGGTAALDFWAARLGDAGVAVERRGDLAERLLGARKPARSASGSRSAPAVSRSTGGR